MKRIEYKMGDYINDVKYIAEAAFHISPSRKSRKAIFECKCGKQFKCFIGSIVSGNTTSCGCNGIESRKERFTKHGLRNHKVYSVWCMIKTRCYNKKRADYKYYGNKGIILSSEFHDFLTFYNYVIALPKYNHLIKLTIDRINTYGNYERGNLRWATRKEQANNRTNGKA